jgi:hypothetical protein
MPSSYNSEKMRKIKYQDFILFSLLDTEKVKSCQHSMKGRETLFASLGPKPKVFYSDEAD